MFKKIRVIINPASGQDRPMLGIMNRAFGPAEIDWEVCITKKAGDARRFAAEASASGYDAVAVYGGDGTVMEVASGLANTGVPLAIFPGGTGNVMSVELGIPSDLAEAVALTCREDCALRTVDMGQVGENWFMLRVGFGFEANMIEGAPRDMKNRFGTLAYAVSALQALGNPTISVYQITIDGKQIATDGMTCIIANAGNMGLPGVKVAPTIEVGDGLLDVIVIRRADFASLVSVAASVVAGNEDAEPLMHWAGRDIHVIADPPQAVQIDGEIVGKVEVRAKVVPGALKIIVPKSSRSG
jgi:YegS/Rv2252/BmrU family lipid kinase